MNDTPWHTDRPLDVEMVGDLVRSQFPSVEAAIVEPIGDGWDFDVFEVNRQWVFRFPKRREYDSRFLTELTLLDEVAGHLPLSVPAYDFRGQSSEAFPYHFGGYAKLHGQAATVVRLSKSAAMDVAAQLGGFLDCLHRCDTPKIRSLDLYGPADHGTTDAQRRETLGYLEKLKDSMRASVYNSCWAFFQDSSRMPSDYDGPLRVLHDDLLPGHILVNSKAGCVSGIIDWSDAAFGDPMSDFVGLWMWGGDDFVARALGEYGLPIDDGIRGRIRYRGLCTIIGELYYAHAQGYDSYAQFCRNCLDREFSGS